LGFIHYNGKGLQVPQFTSQRRSARKRTPQAVWTSV
jgi:hypothetical protein